MDPQRPPRKPTDRRFLTRLVSEIQAWQDQGIITPEQGRALISSYGISPELAASHRAYGRLVTILAIMGAILIGLGIVLFFASNRQDILPSGAKLALVMIGMLAAYGLGYWLRYTRDYLRVGTAVILPGNVGIRRRDTPGGPGLQLPGQ